MLSLLDNLRISVPILYLLLQLQHISTDTDECTQTPEICGLGTCTNNDDGTFYECSCQDGAVLTEIGNTGTFTCVGMLPLSLMI